MQEKLSRAGRAKNIDKSPTSFVPASDPLVHTDREPACVVLNVLDTAAGCAEPAMTQRRSSRHHEPCVVLSKQGVPRFLLPDMMAPRAPNVFGSDLAGCHKKDERSIIDQSKREKQPRNKMNNNNDAVNYSNFDLDQLMSLQPPSKVNPFAHTRVADLFREQARKTPDAIAVEMGDESMTYKELDQRSDLLSSALVETGVRPNDIVAMNLSKNVYQAVGILGVTKR